MHINDGTDQTVDGWPKKDRPIFAERMPSEIFATRAGRVRLESWWHRIGLADGRIFDGDAQVRTIAHQRAELLNGLRPTTFVRESDGAELSLDDVAAEIAQIAEAVRAARTTAAVERLSFGWARVREALAAPDAGEVITDGRWAGFERGAARAWLWNLFQFEPRGFISPGSQVRAVALRELEEGGVPTAFGYPERAAELARNGLTPVTYREAQIALGNPTFASEDVMSG